MISVKKKLILAVAVAALLPAACSPAPKMEEEVAATTSDAGSTVIPMDKAQIEAAQISVEPVLAGGIDAEIVAPGTVKGAPNGEAVLTAGASGTVTRIFHSLGESVRAGETIALVVSREGAGLAADRSVADAKVNLARQQLEREKRLFDQGVSPRQDLEVAEANLAAAEAEAQRASAATSAAHVAADGRTISVVAPISGKVTGISAKLGEFVEPQAELFRVSDARKIQVEASVSASDMARLSAGGRAVVTSSSGQELSAVIRSVTSTVDVETRQATAVLTVEGEGLAAGQLVTVRLFATGASSGTGFSVAQNAVQSVNGQDVVFVQTDAGFRMEPVQVAKRSAGRVQIAGKIEPGQMIATENAFLLKSELGKADTE